jgi:hypothetical protein
LINLEEKKSKALYFEICQGYTKIINDNQELYIKHFGDYHLGQFEDQYFAFFKKAINKGLPSEEDKLKLLIDQDHWSEKEENELVYKRQKIEKLEKIHKNLYLKAQVERSRKEIDSLKKDVKNIEENRKDLMGVYAEIYAQNKLEYIYILNSFYKDPDLKEKLLNIEDQEDIDNNQYYKYIILHNSSIEKFESQTIKKLALCEFLQNLIYMSEQNAYYFYKKPTYLLTYYQSSMFSYGKFFANLLSSPEAKKLDAESKNDPDKLIDWYNAVINFKSKNQNAGSSGKGLSFVMGATEEDIDYLGQEKRVDLNELAKAKGGVLNISDLAKLSTM